MILKARISRFCEHVAMGVNATHAYLIDHPNANHVSANGGSQQYLRRPEVQAEIRRLRAQAQEVAGPAFLSLTEKRRFLARVVRAQIALLPDDSDLWQSVRYCKSGTFFKLPDKIEAIRLDNELSGDESKELGSLTQLLISIRK